MDGREGNEVRKRKEGIGVQIHTLIRINNLEVYILNKY